MRYPRSTSPRPASVLDRGGRLSVRADSTNSCLPQSLLAIVPDCAVNCIQNFASSKYSGSTCANTSDIDYLCTQSNFSGLTIGEGSLQCVVSTCTGQDQHETAVYNVCVGIAGARPRTAKTITATLVGPSSLPATMDTLPATIGQPTFTQQVSTIVMATDAPPWVAATSTGTTSGPLTATTSSSTLASASTEATPGAVVAPSQAASKGGLSTPAVVGIAIAGAATALIAFAVIMLTFCLRKRRRERRRSQRRSRLVEPTPPPHYQSPPSPTVPAFQDNGSTLTLPTAQGRFYGAQQPVEEKRRSFWRRSINPTDIGVAVSPGQRGESPPPSASSQRSITQLLPAVPHQALWPAPLDIGASRERRRYTQRPISEATEFDEEPELQTQQPERIFVDNQPFILEKPPTAKKARPPVVPRLTAVSENQMRSGTQPTRIPLTPTYDNGNIEVFPPPRGFRATSTVRATGYPPLPVAEHKLAPSSAYANRNVLRKKPPMRLPLRAVRSPSFEPLTQPRNAPVPPVAKEASVPVMQRQNSTASVYTEIEEDTTPEENNKQLGLRANPPRPSMAPIRVRDGYPEQGSPIRDLRYPQVPRSSAVSRQAENPAQPRERSSPSQFPDPRPSRDQLVRADMSFVRTDTTSTDGYISGANLEWPVPPTSGANSSRGASGPFVAELRNNPAGGNRQPSRSNVPLSMNQMLGSEARMESGAEQSLSSKARATPSNPNHGDLFFTVEM